MKKRHVLLGISLGSLVVGLAYLAKKTGFLEDDSYLYEEYDTTFNK